MIFSAGACRAGWRGSTGPGVPVGVFRLVSRWGWHALFPRQPDPGCAGARTGTPQSPHLPGPLTVTRRVSVRRAITIGGQKIQVGLAHARKTGEITVESDTYRITVEQLPACRGRRQRMIAGGLRPSPAGASRNAPAGEANEMVT